MDCLKAQEILSEGLDNDVDAASLAEARSHCDGCAECAKLERALDVLTRAAAPTAPADLVDRLLALGAKEAVLIRAAAAEAEEPAGEQTAEIPLVPVARKDGRPGSPHSHRSLPFCSLRLSRRASASAAC